MIKKTILISLLISILTACTDIQPLSDRLIVEIIGIDYDTQNSEYNLSIQLFTPQGGGGSTSIDPTQVNTKLVESKGESLYEALQNATLSIGNSFFYGDTRIIILGDEASKNSLQEVMDFLNNFSETSANLRLVTTKEKASDILKLGITERITPAESITDLLENAKYTGKSIGFSYLEFVQAYLSKTLSPALPVITITKESADSQNSPSKDEPVGGSGGDNSSESDTISPVAPIKLDGVSVFFEKKLYAYLDENETKGLAILRDKLESTNYVAKIEKLKYANVSLYDLKSKIKIESQDGIIYAKIKIKTQGDIKAYTFADGVDKLEDADLKELEANIKNKIESDCLLILKKSLKELNIDLFRFGDKLWKKDKKLYVNTLEKYDEFLENLNVSLEIDVNIDRIGLESILK